MSCWKTQADPGAPPISLDPPGSRVMVSTCWYSPAVIFLAGFPFFVVKGEECLLVPATTCTAVRPLGVRAA